MKFKSIIILFVSIILFFLIGLFYDIQYRTLTRTLILKIANYDLEYYGAKQIRFFVPDLGFILTLIPIGLYITSKLQKQKRNNLVSLLVFSVLLVLFYLFYCFVESQIIKYTTSADIKNMYYYHYQNVNYQLIALFSIISSQILNYFILKKVSIPNQSSTNKN
ncbi:hypothetical protein C8C83_3575 [Flavobacterium sp. 90]|nr:hypothetical protein C8C82_3893 [Flavobacterium sp. 81]TCK55601.1 hypothetical protein C8C83_3575 [Flavobacterium sp. 90]